MDLETFNETKKYLNFPLIDNKIIEKRHLIFIKYTSELYYKYSIELIETLCKKSKFANTKLLFHTTLSFLLKILYNCGNTPCINNFDLLILCSFSIGIKSVETRNKSPSINRLKKIYQEKYYNYDNNEIKLGEIICLKLMNYNINILTPYESLFYLLYETDNLHLFDKCIQHLDNLIIGGDKSFIYKKPLDIAKENIDYIIKKEKEKIKLNKNYNLTYSKNGLRKENHIINNESISTNTSSNNMSHLINNSINSSKGKVKLNNKLKEVYNSKEIIVDIDFNEKLEKNSELKIILNHTYVERNSINKIKENKNGRYLYNINNNKTNKNIDSDDINNIKINKINKDIFMQEIKSKRTFVQKNKEINISNINDNIPINIKSNIINNNVNFRNIKNNINFNSNKLNELCKKMNFDTLDTKINYK